MTRRPSRPQPISAARIEFCLDQLAKIMMRPETDAKLAIPLWRRLERERGRLLDEERIMAEARRRARA